MWNLEDLAAVVASDAAHLLDQADFSVAAGQVAAARDGDLLVEVAAIQNNNGVLILEAAVAAAAIPNNSGAEAAAATPNNSMAAQEEVMEPEVSAVAVLQGQDHMAATALLPAAPKLPSTATQLQVMELAMELILQVELEDMDLDFLRKSLDLVLVLDFLEEPL